MSSDDQTGAQQGDPQLDIGILKDIAKKSFVDALNSVSYNTSAPPAAVLTSEAG